MKRVVVNWSGGKDATCCLQELLQEPGHEVVALLTTLTAEEDRVTQHGTPLSLIRRQAAALGLPLEVVRIPAGADNPAYLDAHRPVLERMRAQGIQFVAFGDVSLQDVRDWREKQLAQVEMQGLFPIWRRKPRELLRDFIRQGFRAVAVAVDGKRVGEAMLGRAIDEEWLRTMLPRAHVGGEGGEYHTFVWDGPLFDHPVVFRAGGILREGPGLRLDLVPEEGLEPR
jgi:uncharacterized protein (TIGR00290 family)